MMLGSMILMGLFSACSGGKERVPVVEEEQETPVIMEEEIAEGSWEESIEQSGRIKKRMRVAQVRDSMERITGTIWGNTTSNWDRYADSLGVPDYQQRMSEDLSPSVMFQKFLNDAATESCKEWMENSTEMFAVDALSTAEEDVLQNIMHLRWRIQGHSQNSEAEILRDYQELHQSVLVRTQEPMEAWQTVCVALFCHPDFWMY